jgi:hypothetical protein
MVQRLLPEIEKSEKRSVMVDPGIFYAIVSGRCQNWQLFDGVQYWPHNPLRKRALQILFD